MFKRLHFFICFMLFITGSIQAQNGTIKGRVVSAVNNQPLAFASVLVQGQDLGAVTDIEGNYVLDSLPAGLYNLKATYVGFETKTVFEVRVPANRVINLDFALEPSNNELGEVVIKSEAFVKKEEAPVSLRTVGVDEIARNPGGNRDISRVIQTLPGVTPTVAFRNDLIIRGGAPGENKFFIDGIEVPTINHFATQGASGGPVGMINVNFLREVEFYSGAFPVNYGPTLSSVMAFSQKDGNRDQIGAQATIGATDFGLAVEGPMGPKASYMVSVRRSYLQLLFQQIGLPFLPIYTDIQFKFKLEPTQKDHITIIGIGAIDNFELNLEANETASQRYILNYLPVNEQYNYTRGVKYTRFHEKSYTNIILSRNKLNNTSVKYENNDDSSDDNLILDYQSQEVENRFRLENVARREGYKITMGVSYEYDYYSNNTFNRVSTPGGVQAFDFESELRMHRYGAFAQVSRKFIEDRLLLSLGSRIDGATFSEETQNPLEQFAPRFSASFILTKKLSINFNTGQYYQLPPYTILGYRDEENQLVNKENDITYIKNRHLVAGIEYTTEKNSRITVESFYKRYYNYPFLLTDSVSLANLGSDFGVIGNEPAESSSEGRSYGVEFLVQQKLYKGFYGILSYTIMKSEFTDKTGQFKPSAWDNRHFVSLTAGKKFKKNWEVGARWWFVTGSPYTPFDIERSSTKAVWDVTGRGIPDYNRLNQARTSNFNQLDLRVDKKWFFNQWSLNLYFDIQNVYGSNQAAQPFLDVVRDENGNPVSKNAFQYETQRLQNNLGTTVPTLGVIVEL